MKMTSVRGLMLSALMVAGLHPGVARAQLETLGVDDVEVIPALRSAVQARSQEDTLNRVVQSLRNQLIDRFNATRKFRIVARSDLNAIMREQGLGDSGNVDSGTAAKLFKLAGAKYLIVTSVDGFVDHAETKPGGETGGTAVIRVLSLAAVGKIYDTTTGKMLESASFQVRKEERALTQRLAAEKTSLSDELLRGVAVDMADKIANRVADVIFPARIIAKTGNRITLNRGDGMFINKGETWNVYELGQDLIDPDTKQVLGREETLKGQVKITEVRAKFSQAEIVGSDPGMQIGWIVRKPQ